MRRTPSLQKVCAESLNKQEHLFCIISRVLAMVAVGGIAE
jgi:hypothetical protein